MATTVEVKKCLWHAFNTLDAHQTGIVQKSRLKVLTSNIGRVFDVDKSEALLDSMEDETIGQSLTFTQFYDVIEDNFLFQLNGNLSSGSTTHILTEIDNICWMLCETIYVKKVNHDTGQLPKLCSGDVFKLLKIFNFCVEVDTDDNTVIFPLKIDIEEAERVCCLISTSLGLCDPRRQFERKGDNPDEDAELYISFPTFLFGLEGCFFDLSAMDLSAGIHEVHDQVVGDIMKKGHMVKFGNRVTNWKERWFVLTPQELRYYTGSDERELRGAINITKSCRLEPIADKIGCKTNRFFLYAANKQYELSAHDLKSRNEWITAIQKAIDHSYASKDQSVQRLSWWDRRKQRFSRRREEQDVVRRQREEKDLMMRQQRELQEEKERNERDQILLEQQMQELECERQARLAMETELREQAVLREAEQKRLKELEKIRKQLEKLLEHERQAKRDEEIVRNLQSRILEEEYEKREELEKLKKHQEGLLDEERRQRVGMETARLESEKLLSEAMDRLNELELEGKEADTQLKDATSKLRVAEEERAKLELRLRVKESKLIGLATPMPVPDPNPLVTHRGLGAFVEAEFHPKISQILEKKKKKIMEL